MIRVAPFDLAKSTSRPLKPKTSILLAVELGRVWTSLRTMSTRWSRVKRGSLRTSEATAIMSSSTKFADLKIMSRWPRVMGSKVPGYMAFLLDGFICFLAFI